MTQQTLSPHSRWLLVRNGAVGDTVLVSSVLRTIRQHFPKAYLEVMGIQERVDLLHGPDLANNAVSSERIGMESLYSKEGVLHPDLKEYFGSFDVILYYAGRDCDRLAKRIIQHDDQIIRVIPAFPPPKSSSPHIVNHYMKALDGIIDYDEAPTPLIQFTQRDLDKAEKRLVMWGIDPDESLVIALHVGAGSIEKQAPPTFFASMVSTIQQRFPVSLLMTQGPSDAQAVQECLKLFPLEVNVHIISELPLRQVSALLSQADLVIGNDSGVTHIAAAVQTPVMAIFIASNPDLWAPLGEMVRVVKLPPSN